MAKVVSGETTSGGKGGQGSSSKDSNKWADYFKSVGNELKDEFKREGEAIVNLPSNLGKKGIVGTFKESILPGATENLKMHGRNVKNFFKTLFNHPEWYGRYPEYLTSNLNWGIRKESFGFQMAIGACVQVKLTIPQRDGVVSQAYKDAINAIFIKVRGSNSGAFNYTAEDVAAYVECVRGMIGVHTMLVRDMHALNNIDPYIAKTPDGLLSTLGYSLAGIQDMKDNKAIYVAKLNQLKNAIEAAFPIMPEMSVVDRTKFIAKALVEEGKGPKSSIYAYRINRVTEASTGSGNEGKVKETSVAAATMPAKIAILEGLINSAHEYVSATYSNYDTFAKIAGDILKAYGNKGFYSLDVCELNKRADVVFDEYLLHQIQNTSTAQVIKSWTLTTDTAPFSFGYYGKFRVDGDSSKTFPVTAAYGIVDSNGHYINIPVNTDKREISGLEAISLTRNVYLCKVDQTTVNYGTDYDAQVWDCDTDIIENILGSFFKPNQGIDDVAVTSRGKSAFPLVELTIWSQIDYFPCVQYFDDSGNGGTNVPLLDVDTFALMTKNQVEIFNDTAVLSLYRTIDIDGQVNFRAVKR